MNEKDYKEVFDYLEYKRYPPDILKGTRSNFRKKCKKFEINKGKLHFKHKDYGLVNVIKNHEIEEIIENCHVTDNELHLGRNKT